MGLGEIHWGRSLKADNFLTVIYQIDAKLPAPAVGRSSANGKDAAQGLKARGGSCANDKFRKTI